MYVKTNKQINKQTEYIHLEIIDGCMRLEGQAT